MSGERRPDWMRLDCSFRRNPKIDAVTEHRGGFEAVVLYLDGLAYCTHHLTDGFIPRRWPRTNGYGVSPIRLLVSVGLWHEVAEICEVPDKNPVGKDAFEGSGEAPTTHQLAVSSSPDGWLVNDYDAYQTTRANWTEQGAKRRDAATRAAAARWASSPVVNLQRKTR